MNTFIVGVRQHRNAQTEAVTRVTRVFLVSKVSDESVPRI